MSPHSTVMTDFGQKIFYWLGIAAEKSKSGDARRKGRYIRSGVDSSPLLWSTFSIKCGDWILRAAHIEQARPDQAWIFHGTSPAPSVAVRRGTLSHSPPRNEGSGEFAIHFVLIL
ncbi:hypothetical protein E2C01_004575 [Portunus trituberculatus]|uniref:Uncharacterized protein n=1 Tax=Portunus trituberculatus TaxID=210409 RepID=A0A5B7CR20_PORTR|nr:hypothetical protein [Portunus trituberculatus]